MAVCHVGRHEELNFGKKECGFRGQHPRGDPSERPDRPAEAPTGARQNQAHRKRSGAADDGYPDRERSVNAPAPQAPADVHPPFQVPAGARTVVQTSASAPEGN